MDEKNIVSRISQDKEFFGEIIDKYEEKLLKYILRITDISIEEADDLLQIIFIKAYKNIFSYDNNISFSSWIYRIAHNTVIDNYRKTDKTSWNISLEDEEYSTIVNSLSDWINPWIDLNKKEIKNCVQKSIKTLQNDYKEVIILKFIEEKSYDEISDILRIPSWTVATLINRAKKQLKETMIKLHCN